MTSILNNLDVLKAVVYKAKLYGAYMLSTCHTLYDVRDQFRVNVFVTISSYTKLQLYSVNQSYNIAYVFLSHGFDGNDAVNIDVDDCISRLNCKVYNRSRHISINTCSDKITKDFIVMKIQGSSMAEVINSMKIAIKQSTYQFILFASVGLQFHSNHFDDMKLRNISPDPDGVTWLFVVDVAMRTVHNNGSMFNYTSHNDKNIYIHESLIKQLPHKAKTFKSFMSIDNLASLHYYLNTTPPLYNVSLNSLLVKYITSHNHIIRATNIRMIPRTKNTHVSSNNISCKHLSISSYSSKNIVTRIYCDKHIEYSSNGDIVFIFDGYNVFYDKDDNKYLIVFGGRHIDNWKKGDHYVIDRHLNMDMLEIDLPLLMERYIFVKSHNIAIPKDDYYEGEQITYRKVVDSPHLIIRNKNVHVICATFTPINEKSPYIEIIDCGIIDMLIVAMYSCLFKTQENVTIISKTYIREIRIIHTELTTLTYNNNPTLSLKLPTQILLWHSETDPTTITYARS